MAVASAGPYASLHHAPDRQQRQHPTTQVFYRPDALPAAQPTASKHLHRNSEITLWDTDSHLLFQTWSKSVQDKYLKGCICIGDKKHVLVVFGRTPGVISPNFLFEHALWYHTYIPGFIQSVQVWGSYN